ncbi:hypothetical protein KAF25_001473 [Fusarium avenaceum]|uniref:Uncharacterized protein n=1 Tax=Fusarium avenaceum TaxID=40199 RepID=A0A9P7HEX4_9HYPO|nr:hypothetical protein KAF25_001473 [Fusarium avenaceum]
MSNPYDPNQPYPPQQGYGPQPPYYPPQQQMNYQQAPAAPPPQEEKSHGFWPLSAVVGSAARHASVVLTASTAAVNRHVPLRSQQS